MSRGLLWGIAGLLSYLGGAIFLAMGVAPLIEAGSVTEQPPDLMMIGLIVASGLLFGLGGMCLRRAVSSPRASKTTTSLPTDQSVSTKSPEEVIACDACGTMNESFYSYCEECASEL